MHRVFQLEEGLVRQLIFAVENKKVALLVDVASGRLVREEEIPPDERPVDRSMIDVDAAYAYPPDWTSADGFALMDRFAAGEADPVVAAELRTALDSGRGVFRAFKDVLRAYPAAEHRWQAFKSRVLRDVVLDWYDVIREIHGLDAVERGVDEEIDDLVGEAFALDYLEGIPFGDVVRMVSEALAEAWHDLPADVTAVLHERHAATTPPEDAADHHVIVALGPDGRRIACLWYHVVTKGAANDRVATLEIVFVDRAYRGLGVGTRLVGAFLKRCGDSACRVLVKSPGSSDWFVRRFPNCGVREAGTILYVDRP